MRQNVGRNESIARLSFGMLAAFLALTTRRRWLRLPLGMMAFSGITTALSRYCPGNELLGINTASEPREPTRVAVRRGSFAQTE